MATVCGDGTLGVHLCPHRETPCPRSPHCRTVRSRGHGGHSVDRILDDQVAAVALKGHFGTERSLLDGDDRLVSEQHPRAMGSAIWSEHAPSLGDKTVQVHLVFAHEYVQQRLHDRSAPTTRAARGGPAWDGDQRGERTAPHAVRRLSTDCRVVTRAWCAAAR